MATGDNVKAALIAMAAAKERQPAREAVNDKPSLRKGDVRRVAGPTVAVPAGAPQAAPDGDQAERPED